MEGGDRRREPAAAPCAVAEVMASDVRARWPGADSCRDWPARWKAAGPSSTDEQARGEGGGPSGW